MDTTRFQSVISGYAIKQMFFSSSHTTPSSHGFGPFGTFSRRINDQTVSCGVVFGDETSKRSRLVKEFLEDANSATPFSSSGNRVVVAEVGPSENVQYKSDDQTWLWELQIYEVFRNEPHRLERNDLQNEDTLFVL